MKVTKVSGRLYRGPQPKSLADLLRIKQEFGVARVLSLNSGVWEVFQGDMGQEREWCREAGLMFDHIQMHPFFAPDPADITRVLALLSVPAPETYVHCFAGVDRTGMVCAAYRVRVLGWPIELAIEEMFRMGFHRKRFFSWPKKLRRYLESEAKPQSVPSETL